MAPPSLKCRLEVARARSTTHFSALSSTWARRVRTEDDYLVAGRRLGLTFASVSVFATWFGAETCVGAAGQIYDTGLGVHSVEPFAYGICLVVMGLVFAAPFWRLRITTLADFFRRRFGSDNSTHNSSFPWATRLLGTYS